MKYIRIYVPVPYGTDVHIFIGLFLSFLYMLVLKYTYVSPVEFKT